MTKMVDKLIKNTNQQNIINQQNIQNIENNGIKNTSFIFNNYKNPHNIEDLLKKYPLTQEEKDDIIKKGPLAGCVYVLNSRCIKNVHLSKRPIHCVDKSRQKYVIFSGDEWHIDKGGVEIVKQIIPTI